MIPYTNATLTSITPVGTSADYDTPAAAGTPRWTGNLPVYVAEELQETDQAVKVDELVHTRLEIPYSVGRLIARGDTLTFTYEDASHQRVARDIIRAQLVDRVRVILQEA